MMTVRGYIESAPELVLFRSTADKLSDGNHSEPQPQPSKPETSIGFRV